MPTPTRYFDDLQFKSRDWSVIIWPVFLFRFIFSRSLVSKATIQVVMRLSMLVTVKQYLTFNSLCAFICWLSGRLWCLHPATLYNYSSG